MVSPFCELEEHATNMRNPGAVNPTYLCLFTPHRMIPLPASGQAG